jgi:hypothetical protein
MRDRTNRQTPEERLQELAGILALAIVRLRLRAALPDCHTDGEKPLESGPNCLEVSPDTRLSVHTG